MKTKAKPESRPVEVLLVEDSRGDERLMREMLGQSRFPIHLTVARDGEAALDHLKLEKAGTQPVPDLILLDLGLPRMDGRQVLAEIKKDHRLRDIPVLILTSSREDSDIRMAYERHANFYIVKPLRLDHFSVLLKYLEDFWLRTFPLAM